MLSVINKYKKLIELMSLFPITFEFDYESFYKLPDLSKFFSILNILKDMMKAHYCILI